MDRLEGSRCGRVRPAGRLATLCDCGAPLLVRYRVSKGAVSRGALSHRPFTLWRYLELLPAARPVTLGEGGTPLLPVPRIAQEVGLEKVWVKEESTNPTGSFKARGLGVAVTMARAFGVK